MNRRRGPQRESARPLVCLASRRCARQATSSSGGVTCAIHTGIITSHVNSASSGRRCSVISSAVCTARYTPKSPRSCVTKLSHCRSSCALLVALLTLNHNARSPQVVPAAPYRAFGPTNPKQLTAPPHFGAQRQRPPARARPQRLSLALALALWRPAVLQLPYGITARSGALCQCSGRLT
jgi:hypothetical protein